MEIREGLTFDDVLLVPKYSEVESRSDVDLSCKLFEREISVLSKPLKVGFSFKHPIIPANMKSITEYEMARAILKTGGLAILHRFIEPEKQLLIMKNLEMEYGRTIWIHVGMSVGVKTEDYQIVDDFVHNGAEILCIDVAHGDSKLCVDMCQFIAEKYPDVLLIAGNVATGEAAKRLWLAGADLVKVGVGNGSICSTRLETGSGVPQLSALMGVSAAKKELTEQKQIWVEDLINATGDDRPTFIPGYFENIPPIISRPIGIIADGGCNKVADLCKSLCFADFVMTGNLFAGSDECPGELIEQEGKKFKRYDGSSTYKGTHVEGVKAMVPYKGSVKKILERMFDGISSCCSYQGVSKVSDLQKDPQFVRISNSGLIESNIHNVQIVKE
jgi:IMP dehydrogenase